MIDTYNSKTAVSVSVDGNKIGNFVFNGLVTSGDGISGLACNTTGIHYGNVFGNADTATKWKTARTLTLVGSVSGSTSLDGSDNVTLNTSLQGSGVSILTGTIAHGGTIPLPAGYTQDQCKWMVSVNEIGVKNDNTTDTLTCSAINRVVTISMIYTSVGTLTGRANYIIIGVK